MSDSFRLFFQLPPMMFNASRLFEIRSSARFVVLMDHTIICHHKLIGRYPDEEAGQVPMAFVVRQSGSIIDKSQIKDFIAERVLIPHFCPCMIILDESKHMFYILYFQKFGCRLHHTRE